MKNLVAFGCSYAYGHGLDDCFENIERASTYAWPALLANMLGANTLNYARPGSSNMEILHSILNRVPKKDECYVIMWTYPERDMVFDMKYLPARVFNQIQPNALYEESEGTLIRFGPWIGDSINKDWTMVHTTVDCIIRSWYMIHYAFLHLKSLGVQQHHYFADYSPYSTHKPLFVSVKPIDSGINRRKVDYALDKIHPGPLTHAMIAKEMFETIKRDYAN